MVMPRMTTLVLASMPKALAKLVNCVMTMSPPVDIIDIITNMSQNTGDFSISRGLALRTALVKVAAADHAAAANQARQALLGLQADVIRQIERAGGSVSSNGERITGVNLDQAKDLAAILPLLRELPDLNHVSLSNRGMDSKLMAELRDLPKLRSLNLYRSGIGDAGLEHFKTLPALRSVPMGETKVTDAGLKHLKDLTHLEYVGVRGDDVTDAGLEHLKDLTNLTGLYLGETKVTDAGMVHLKRMKKLTYIRLDTTAVTDAGLVHLEQLTSLQHLYVERTKVTAAGVARLKKALPQLQVTMKDSD